MPKESQYQIWRSLPHLFITDIKITLQIIKYIMESFYAFQSISLILWWRYIVNVCNSLYIIKHIQQQMKWEKKGISIRKEWGSNEIYTNFYFTYLVRWCAVCYSPRADTTMATAPVAASDTKDTNNWRATIKSIAVTWNLDFIERLH